MPSSRKAQFDAAARRADKLRAKGATSTKTGEETIDLYAFFTTDPTAEVGVVNPKAMLVILTTPEECETWMTAPRERAKDLQRPFA